jgi:hypothetical protein
MVDFAVGQYAIVVFVRGGTAACRSQMSLNRSGGIATMTNFGLKPEATLPGCSAVKRTFW